MANEREIELVIRAKNLTDDAFKKVKAAVQDIETTSARTTSAGTTAWGKWFATIGGGVATGNLLSDAFKKVGSELIDLPNKLIAFGARGADVRDVKTAFDGLTTSVGTTSTAMLGQLRTAFGGTVADFDLMSKANEGLSKGVKFTAEDMGTLGKAARVMADRVGGDAKQSFDKLITGIADGREKTLKQLPLNFANIEAAVKSYADSIDVEVSKLSDAQKQEALRIGVLKESQRILAESGEVENDFADKVAAGAATVRNFTDGLAESVAKHGTMIAGLGGMAQAAATLTPLLGMTGLAGAASTLAAVLLGPVGLVVGIGAAAVAFTAFKVSDINAQADAFEQASVIIGRAAKNITEARDVIKAFEAGQTGAKMSGQVTTEMAAAWMKGAEAAGQMKTAVTSLHIEGFGPGLTTTKSYAQVVKELRAEVGKMPAEIKNEVDAMRLLGKSEEFIQDKLKLTTSQLKILDQLKKDHAKSTKSLATEAAELVKRIEAEAKAHHENQVWVGKNTIGLRELVEAKRRLAVLTPPLIEDYSNLRQELEPLVPLVHRLADALEEAADVQGGVFKKSQEKISRVIAMASAELEKQAARAREVRQSILSIADAVISTGVFGSMTDDVINITRAWDQASIAAENYATATTKVGKAAAVAQGASAVWAGTASQSRGAAVAGGALAGAQAGMMFGPYGAAIGAVAGAITGLVRSAGQGRDAIKAFADSFGGFKGLQEKLAKTFDPDTAHRYWVALTQGTGKNNPQQAKAIIDEVTAALQKQQDVLNKTPPSYAEAAAAAEYFGLKANEVGDGLNQLRVSDTVAEIVKQWEILSDAGADMSQVAVGAADEIQAMVDESLIWGHTLPPSIRKVVEEMQKMGLLTDAAGKKLENLDDIKWDKPLGASIDDLTTSMRELADVIRNEVGGAISNLPDVDVAVRYHRDGDGSDISHDTGAFIRKDHVANVHAGELIGPVDFMSRALAGALQMVSGGVGGAQEHRFVLTDTNGRELARFVSRQMTAEYRMRGMVGAV